MFTNLFTKNVYIGFIKLSLFLGRCLNPYINYSYIDHWFGLQKNYLYYLHNFI